MARTVVVRTAAGERYRNEVSVAGHRLVADEGSEVGGKDAGPSPMELLAAALGTCTSMTLRMYAERKGIDLQEVEVVLVHEPGDPKAGTKNRIQRNVRMRGALDAEQRKRLLEIADRCPVHRALAEGVEIATREA